MNPTAIRVRIFYPADPMGVVPGGIDTFLRGLIKFAPDDVEFSLVGMTTDPSARPVGTWTRCRLGQRWFAFYPVLAQRDAGGRSRVPLSVRYSIALRRQMGVLHGGFDVFDFHRIEPSLLFMADNRPKNFTFHNDPQTLRLSASDNLWKHLPQGYERLEAQAMRTMSSAWCVRESGVQALRQRYAERAAAIGFMPTWVDADLFHPVDEDARARLRRAKAVAHELDTRLPWIISVGRLDTQKNPMLMLRALVRLRRAGTRAHWLVIGDGVLRAQLERKVAEWGLGKRVRFLGLLPQSEIADWLRASDVYALSSAYEGMPMALLEALGSGLPACTTDVGEVRKLVTPGINGAIALRHTSRAMASALVLTLNGAERFRGEAALAAVRAFQPRDVLAPAYANYRRIGGVPLTLRLSAERAHRGSALKPDRVAVFGIPIDAVERTVLNHRLIGWARMRQSRYACFVNVHSTVQAARDERHRLALLGADVAAPDGAPVAWTMGLKRGSRQTRVDGPRTMWQLCHDAAEAGVRVGLYGGSRSTLQALEQALMTAVPHLQLVYAYAPPFRDLSVEEDEVVCAEIAMAEVGLLFVGLGCPKQEHWMASHRGRVRAVMLGVGAAFDIHAGAVPWAPPWMRNHGLEWLHRLATEPRRLGGRYLQTNSLFLAKSAFEASRHLQGRMRNWRTPAAGVQTRSPVDPGPAPTSVISPVIHPALKPVVNLQMSPSSASSARPAALQLAAVTPSRGAASHDDGVDTVVQSCPYESDPRSTLDGTPFEGLVRRVEGNLAAMPGRLIGFIASGVGEGTSTMARSYVTAASAQLQRRVLLLETQGEGWGSGVMHALAANRSLNMLLRPLLGGGMAASLGGGDVQRAVSELATRTELWDELRSLFDEIVLDLPASRASGMGLSLAPYCDGVVVVVEAGKTRAPVVKNLVAELRAAKANILGTVLNKRRFHVPAPIYRWL